MKYRGNKERRERRSEQIAIRLSRKERDMVIRVAHEKHDYPASLLRRVILAELEKGNKSNQLGGMEAA